MQMMAFKYLHPLSEKGECVRYINEVNEIVLVNEGEFVKAKCRCENIFICM